MRPREAGLVALAVLVAVLAVACGRPTADPDTDPRADQLLHLDAAAAQEHIDGLRGQPVLLNVWGSWCPPCRDEAPTLAAAARRYGDRVAFLGIDVEDTEGGALGFLAAFDVPFPSVFDPQGAVARALDLRGTPVTVILDATGAEVFRRVGSISEAELLAALDDVLAAP
jgi:thiol-disulfide isomerase/thioredoxin